MCLVGQTVSVKTVDINDITINLILEVIDIILILQVIHTTLKKGLCVQAMIMVI